MVVKMQGIETFHPKLSPAQVAELTRLLGEIDEFKGHWRKLGEIRAERLASLRQVTTIESAGSSTRIEGAQLSDDEVAKVLGGLRVDSFRERDEGEVRGYGELLQTIFDNFNDIPLTENYLKQLHKILLGHVEKDAWHRGQYKQLENPVEATHPDGQKEVIFHTTSVFDTPRLMEELVADTGKAFESDSIHSLIAIGRFIVGFLAIHPFQDGNGRLSRALTALLMLRSGYEYVPYASLERVIEQNKLRYYEALRASQSKMASEPSDFGDWLLYFLRVLKTQKVILAGKLEVERSIVQLSSKQLDVLALVENHGSRTSTDIARELKISPRSARYHLGLLVERGLLRPLGERSGRIYLRGSAPVEQHPEPPESKNASILAVVLQRGGSITRAELRQVVLDHGADLRIIGSLHGRRKAHLRKEGETSVLTARGREVAEQYLFASRLSRSVDEIKP